MGEHRCRKEEEAVKIGSRHQKKPFEMEIDHSLKNR